MPEPTPGLLRPLELLHLAAASPLGIVVYTSDQGICKQRLESAKQGVAEFQNFYIRIGQRPNEVWIVKGKRGE